MSPPLPLPPSPSPEIRRETHGCCTGGVQRDHLDGGLSLQGEAQLPVVGDQAEAPGGRPPLLGVEEGQRALGGGEGEGRQRGGRGEAEGLTYRSSGRVTSSGSP